MHGRKNPLQEAAAGRPQRGKRYRLNFELDCEQEAALDAQSKRLGVTKTEWVRGTLRASLGRRGIAHAAQILLKEKEAQDRRTLLHGGLHVLSLLRSAPPCQPNAPLIEHVAWEIYNARLTEIRDMLRILLRHVAAMEKRAAAAPAGDMSESK